MTDQPDDRNTSDRSADQQLDQLLTELLQQQQTAPGHLHARILANLPTASPAEEIFSWLTGSLWRSAWAAALPLVFGFALGIAVSLNDDSLSQELDIEALVFTQQIEEFDVDEF